MASHFGADRVPMIHHGAFDQDLDDCVVLIDEPVPDVVQHISPINGHRTTIVRGYHWIFEARLNFWKTGTLFDFEFWLSEVGETGHRIRRFGDDDYIQSPAGADVFFTLVLAKPAFLTNSRDKDTLILRWESNDYVGIHNNVVPV